MKQFGIVKNAPIFLCIYSVPVFTYIGTPFHRDACLKVTSRTLFLSRSPLYLSFFRVSKETMERSGFQGNLEQGGKSVFQVYQEIRVHLAQR